MTWPRVPLRRLARLGSGHTPSRSVAEYWENCTIPWFTLADIGQVRDDRVTTVYETKEKISELGLANSAAELHPAGTVVLSRTASVGFSAILGRPMATSQDFATWTCGPRLEPLYLLYALRGLRDEILGMRMGSTHQTIYMPDIERITVPLAPLAWQRATADYLDAETARIDALIAGKRRLLALLAERRASATVAGVGGRTTCNGPFAESGLAWLQSIPAHWDEVPIRLVATVGTGHTPSRDHPEWWIECVVPWVTTGEVSQMRSDRIEYLHDTRERISHAGIANSSAVIHPAGTVVLCRTAASAGYSAIMGADMATSQDIVTWTCGPLLNERFLLLCLRAMRTDLLERLAIGSTHKTIYMPDVYDFRIPLPPVDQQVEIVEATWRRLDVIDATSSKIESQIALLQERRQALISAAVTGELHINGSAA